MFGHPTGVGVLIARRDALETLHRPWFSGGTIDVASVQGDRHFMSVGPHAFEDGTVDYLSIPAVEFGLDLLDSVTMSVIHDRVRCLTAWLLDQLSPSVTQTVAGSFGCMVRSRRKDAAVPWHSICVTLMGRFSITGASMSGLPSSTSPSVPDVFAIREPERLHLVFRRTN